MPLVYTVFQPTVPIEIPEDEYLILAAQGLIHTPPEQAAAPDPEPAPQPSVAPPRTVVTASAPTDAPATTAKESSP